RKGRWRQAQGSDQEGRRRQDCGEEGDAQDGREEVGEQERWRKEIGRQETGRKEDVQGSRGQRRKRMTDTVEAAALALRRGGVVAYPTEAVWGLGCDPQNPLAVNRLLELKQRPRAVGVLLIGATFEQLSVYIGPCPDEAIARAQATWPGPHTWIFPRSARVPDWIAGAHPGIALRVTAH